MHFRISHISTSDTEGGSAESAKRIHQNLLKRGFLSKMFVGNLSNETNDRENLTIFPFLRILDKYFDILMNKFGMQYYFIPSNIGFNRKLYKSDIIQIYNLHGGYFQFNKLKKLSKISKLVIRFSDYWNLTGHCSYPGDCDKWIKGCGKCPNLKSYPEIGLDLTTNIWKRKNKTFNTIDLSVVVPTKKMFTAVKKSDFFKKKKIHIIPNGVDTNKYKPMKKVKARNLVGLKNKFTILFISHIAFNNARKGTEYIEKLLREIDDIQNIQKVIVGHQSDKWNKFKFRNLRTFNFIKDHKTKNLLYNSADLTLVPSINENFPNVVLESMSAGVPVLSFLSGGLNEIINNNNGIILKSKNINELKSSILLLKKNKRRKLALSKNSRETILKKYSESIETEKFIKLYKDLKNNEK